MCWCDIPLARIALARRARELDVVRGAREIELLFGAVKAFRGWNPGNLHKHAFNAWIDILIRSDETGEAHYRFVVGDQDFVSSSSKGDCLGLVRQPNGGYVPLYKGETWEVLYEFTQDAEAYESSSIPGAIYLPADRRFVLPEEKYKSPGRLEMRQDFFFRLNKPKSWKDSVEALLYAARWEDLNAIAEGRPGEARHFDAYAAAFHAFFGQAKSLIWDRGELFIRMADTGQLHSIAELSSGEQQVLLLVGVEGFEQEEAAKILDLIEISKLPGFDTILTDLRQRAGARSIAL